MAIYALADLHLSHDRSKPMDVFGDLWENHVQRIEENWRRVVGKEDLVIVAGDISWAMRLPEAVPDLRQLGALPGTKVLIRGNHDYWWSSLAKVRAALPPTVHAIQNDHYLWEDWVVCGTRGWLCPGEEGFDDAEDKKIYLREVHRLELSLKSAVKSPSSGIIAALHFPPFDRRGNSSDFTALLHQYGVRYCVFGHIHDEGREYVSRGVIDGIDYRFVAADGVNFTPQLLE